VINSSVNLTHFSILCQIFYIKNLMKTIVIIRVFYFLFFVLFCFFVSALNSKHYIYINISHTLIGLKIMKLPT
jgi:hypothetical protein